MIPWLVLLQATLTIATGSATAPQYWPLWVAQSEGYFAQEGLTVTLSPARAEAPAAEALARGRADLAATSLDAAITLGHVGSAPPKIVFGLAATPAVALLVPIAQQETVKSLADLAGKTIGVSAPGTPDALALLSLLDVAGIAVPRLTVKSYGERGLAGAIAAGEVAAGIIGDPAATQLVEEGRAVVLVDLRKRDAGAGWLGAPTVDAAIFARPDTTLGPAQLRPLCRALLRALARLETATPEELRATLPADATGFPEGFAARLLGARGIYLRDGWVSPDMLRASVALVRNRSAIPAKVSVPRNIDRLLLTDSLKEVLASRR
jgi:NitT/TauT family transport system substrate-binding protein